MYFLKDDVKKYRTELKTWYKEMKAAKCCELCGSIKYKQYHHVNPDEKTESVAQMVHKAYPKEVILKEMDKCIVVCRSCHCRLHNQMKKKKD